MWTAKAFACLIALSHEIMTQQFSSSVNYGVLLIKVDGEWRKCGGKVEREVVERSCGGMWKISFKLLWPRIDFWWESDCRQSSEDNNFCRALKAFESFLRTFRHYSLKSSNISLTFHVFTLNYLLMVFLHVMWLYMTKKVDAKTTAVVVWKPDFWNFRSLLTQLFELLSELPEVEAWTRSFAVGSTPLFPLPSLHLLLFY